MFMKKILFLLLIVVSLTAASCSSNSDLGLDSNADVKVQTDDTLEIGHEHVDLSTFPIQDISENEKLGMLLMREEEKLARDVYSELYDIWGQKTFLNIAQSENTHTMEVKGLIDRYELEDPVTDNTRGVFKSEELRDMYDELLELGSTSLGDALIVGAMIEDMDIFDLDKLISETDNEDIKYVYGSLKSGSENHIRSFTKQLDKNGLEYVPTYISQETYDKILSTAHTGSGLKSDGTHEE